MATNESSPLPKAPDRYVGNILVPSIILAMTMVCLFQTLGFPGGDGDVGPAGVPYLWIGFTTLFAVGLIAQAAMKKMPPDPVPGRWGFVLVFFGGLIVYLLAIQNLGYYASTFLFLVASMLILGYRNYAVILSVAAGWLVFCYLVFAKMLYIPLPEGPLMRMLLGLF